MEQEDYLNNELDEIKKEIKDLDSLQPAKNH